MKSKILFITLLMASVPAFADEQESSSLFFKPYVGIDYQYTAINYKNGNDAVLADNLSGGDIHFGAKVHNNFGLEIGYFDNKEENKSNVLGSGFGTSAKISGWTLDALGYLPIGESKRFELIGTVGVARTEAEAKVSAPGIASISDTETELRFGGGAQYKLTDSLNLRSIVRYQTFDFDDTGSNAVIASIGFNYEF